MQSWPICPDKIKAEEPRGYGLHRSHLASHSLTPHCKNLCSSDRLVLSRFPSNIPPASVLQSIRHSRHLPASQLWVLHPRRGLHRITLLLISPAQVSVQCAFAILPPSLQSSLTKPGCQEPATQSPQPESSLISCKIHSCRHAPTCCSIINWLTAAEPTRAFLDACLNQLGHASKPGRNLSHLTRRLLP